MKVGILGGTFDPVHFGHLITAQSVLELRNLDKIIFLPCRVSPFKTGRMQKSPLLRYEMLRIALKNSPFFELSDLEVSRDKVSYTVDSLRFFANQYEHLELIIGFDNLLEFHNWKQPEEIIKMAKIVVMRRQGSFLQAKPDNNFAQHATYVDTPVVEISATMIRNRIKKGKPIDFFVPQGVLDYIRKNDLYK